MQRRAVKPRATPTADDPDDRLIVRVGAAQILGCSESTIRRLERGPLPPACVVHGVHWHSTKRVLSFKAAAHVNHAVESVDVVDGGLAAAAFTLFDSGASGADIVRTLRVSPKVARELQEAYADLANQIVISGIDAVKLREIMSGRDEECTLRNGSDLVKLIEAIDWPACLHCHRTARFCIFCFHTNHPRVRAIAATEVAKAAAARSAERKRDEQREAIREARNAAAKRSGAPAQSKPHRASASDATDSPRSSG